MKHANFILVAALTGTLAFGQQQPVHRKPVPAKRVPALRPTPADYQRAAHILQDQPPVVLRGTIDGHLPEDQPMILPQSALQAVQLEGQWRNGDGIPMQGSDGRIVYTYGEGMPNIPCAVHQVTVIELRPGERLNPENGWEIGDSREWKIDQHTISIGDKLQSFIALTPKYSGSDTTFTIFTDQRVYYTRLLSTPDQFIARVAWKYPVADAAEEVASIEKQRVAEQEQKKKAAELAAADTMGPLKNTQYTVKVGRHAKYMEPTLIGDDGAHTIIQLSEKARNRDLPVLQVLDFTGKELPNVHMDPKTLRYTVEGLFTKAQLISGVGRHQLKVTITNKGELDRGR